MSFLVRSVPCSCVWPPSRHRRNTTSSPCSTSSTSGSRAAGSISTTEIRLDSEALGRGTTLNFEDDLDLDPSKTIPTLSFEWQIARKHKLGVRWQDISRDSSSQALTEIHWGDEIIPIDADISLGFDITQYFVDYAYYPWVKERWAAGFGLGLRLMTLQATLAVA